LSGRERALLWAPALLWAALLIFLGSRPLSQLPAGDFWALPGVDKAAHATIYGILGFLVARAVRPRGASRSLLLGLLTGCLWGMLDEWVQSHVPGRTPAWTDLAADALGAAAGAWACWRFQRSRRPC
jgi:uncharacterized protein YfiM (DUF2279 family)